MKKRLFSIPSLLAAGFLPSEGLALPTKPTVHNDFESKSLFDVFRLNHRYTLAGHRSHSSHASHSSHRSSSGGYYSPPSPTYTAPVYQAPAVVSPSPSTPAPLVTLPGNSGKFTEIVRDVQFAMLAFGYYNGELDGVFSPAMKAALSRLQADYGLKVTGTITPETLTALRITAR